MSTSIVIAHYSPAGLLRDDLLEFCKLASLESLSLCLVSTNLKQCEMTKLPGDMHVIVRPNFGYDFFSYKKGIEYFVQNTNKISSIKKLVLMNSSFLITRPHELIGIINAKQNVDILGLTSSYEYNFHIQSYFVSFGVRILESGEFLNWWDMLAPIDEREKVIERYELTMTNYFSSHGFHAESYFVPTWMEKFIAVIRAFKSKLAITKPRVIVHPLELNPTVFYWDALFKKTGILKAELLCKSPYGFQVSNSRILKNAKIPDQMQ